MHAPAMDTKTLHDQYINLRRSRDVFVPSFVCSFVCLLLSLQFALASFYVDCPHKLIYIYIYIIQILSVCVSVCLSSIGGQTAGPIMTKFGTHMRIDLGMVPTKNWPHEWPGSVGSLGPISESGLSCQLLLRAVV